MVWGKEKIEKEITDIYKKLMKTYYIDHDLESFVSALHPNFSAIGTGRDEIIEKIEKAKVYFKRDFNQGPNPIYIDYYSINPIVLSEYLCIVLSSYKLSTIINGCTLEFDYIRSSMIFLKEEERWHVVHSHISMPYIIQKEGESFPLEALKFRSKIYQNITEKRSEELSDLMENLEKLASFDKMTKIYNRGKMEEMLSYEIERAKRYGHPLSLLLFDIDHFKNVNDTFGHLVGDKVLFDTASIIRNIIRKSDVFGRWGGDEFVILCPNTTLNGALSLGEKIRKKIEKSNFGIDIPITLSIGITQFIPKKDDSISIIKRADKLLYEAKDMGRNSIKTG